MVAVSAGDGDFFRLDGFLPARKLMRKVIPESAMLKAQAPLRPDHVTLENTWKLYIGESASKAVSTNGKHLVCCHIWCHKEEDWQSSDC